MVILGKGAVSHERGTPVLDDPRGLVSRWSGGQRVEVSGISSRKKHSQFRFLRFYALTQHLKYHINPDLQLCKPQDSFHSLRLVRPES